MASKTRRFCLHLAKPLQSERSQPVSMPQCIFGRYVNEVKSRRVLPALKTAQHSAHRVAVSTGRCAASQSASKMSEISFLCTRVKPSTPYFSRCLNTSPRAHLRVVGMFRVMSKTSVNRACPLLLILFLHLFLSLWPCQLYLIP